MRLGWFITFGRIFLTRSNSDRGSPTGAEHLLHLRDIRILGGGTASWQSYSHEEGGQRYVKASLSHSNAKCHV